MKEENTESFLSSEQDEGFDLFSYIESENINQIEEFLKSEPPIWEYRDKNNDNSTVLHISVFKKSYRITKLIIDYCLSIQKEYEFINFINYQNDKGVTALHYASYNGNIQIIHLLIDNKADIKAITKKGLNIIHYCAQGNKPNSLMYFYLELEDKTYIKRLIKEEDVGGSTPLHWAAYSNSEDVLMYLINLNIFQGNERQEFIDKQDNQGFTPLHLSVSSKSRRIVMKLLQSGANADIKDSKNRTPLDLANSKGYKEIIDILKNNQSCQICNFKAPVKQIKKSKKNIILVFFFQTITVAISYFSLIPIALYSKINDNNNTNISSFFIYIFLFLLFLIIYIILLKINPGEIKKKDEKALKALIEKETDENKKNDDLDLSKYCYKCFVEKTKISKHCIVCDKCYEDFDHHCYWINKCVAKNNYYLFISFLVITFLYLSFLFSLCVRGLINYFIIDDEYYYFSLFSFELIKIKKNILIPEYGKYFHLTLIILLLLINLSFLVPEFLLLILHLKVCCIYLKVRKKRNESSINMKLIDNSNGSLNLNN